jgi:hypothetical protein
MSKQDGEFKIHSRVVAENLTATSSKASRHIYRVSVNFEMKQDIQLFGKS